jgi:adenosine deaminase CECR1
VAEQYDDRFIFSEDGEENVSHRTMLAEYDRILNEVRQDIFQEDRKDEFFGSKVHCLSNIRTRV